MIFFNKNPRLCKSTILNQTAAEFLQAKSNVNAVLAQTNTKKEYKKLMATVLSSMDSESEGEEDEKSL
ncbi:hypothetical protein Gogos_000612, partial [Gossypium gossypioides]|nr:hypothetical protein [Gossypium gossypioides]